MFTSKCHPQGQQKSFYCQQKDSLRGLHVVYEPVFKLVLCTKLDRTFYHLFRVAVKSCTDASLTAQQQILLVLVTPEIILHSEHHLLALNYLYMYVDIKHFSILELEKCYFLKNHTFFADLQLVFCLDHCIVIATILAGMEKNPMIFKIHYFKLMQTYM